MSASPQTPAADAAATVDERNPWLGLASFTEETRSYFYGRDEEVAELARRVQRRLLTVLFGQSGLGKTSILRAGLVPRLRGQGYCPVYVRIDYGRDAPEPAEQIKQAIARTARRSGQWTQAGVAVAGESLWEFLHHRDDVLLDENGKTLIPLLIFDQFEEIFTLAQSDDFGRARAQRFIADLADLVENRPPREFEARLEHDDSAAQRFDFARSDYRVLIALREDYLAPLEGLKAAMPSVTQNRLRLAPMTGRQALEAVLKPGRGLVSQEVAEAIVRFVAGGAELANAEVEPSLLSLICRELNDTRIAAGRSEISLDLLAGSHETILVNFYERSLADQPAAVRRIIEDELLTASGFRENVAEERVLASFAAAGAAPDTLATLVNRRLLRVEERLDVRRVELTHDVLCGVVKQSRDLRREREARDEAERLFNEQRDRARATRRALVRARQVAAVCIVLALGAIVAAALAYRSTQRARAAERQAEQARAAADETRILTEQARGQAEQLLGYLTEDFSRELAGLGRLDIVAELARREMEYFKALPPELKGGDTTRNGALAMVYYARAMRGLGKVEQGAAAATEAVRLLEEMRAQGDASEAAATATALALHAQAAVLDNKNDPAALPTMKRAADMLAPVADAPHADLAARRAYVEVLERLGMLQLRAQQLEDAKRSLTRARAGAEAAGARDLANPDMTAEYVIATAWLMDALSNTGHGEEARRIGADAKQLADRLIDRRPNYLPGLRALQLIASDLGGLEADAMRPTAALAAFEPAMRSSAMLLKLDPENTIVANNLVVDTKQISDAYWARGEPRASIATYRNLAGPLRLNERGGSSLHLNALFQHEVLAERHADVGDRAAARTALAELEASLARMRAYEPADSVPVKFATCNLEAGRGRVAMWGGELAEARDGLTRCLDVMEQIAPRGPTQSFTRAVHRYYTLQFLALVDLERRDHAGAEQAIRKALEIRQEWPLASTGDRRDLAWSRMLLAMALAGRGDTAGAAREVAPAVKLHRELSPRNVDDQWQRLELALALHIESLGDPGRREALLRESRALVAALPAEMRGLRSVLILTRRINGETRPAG